jgi:hypothetical protein
MGEVSTIGSCPGASRQSHASRACPVFATPSSSYELPRTPDLKDIPSNGDTAVYLSCRGNKVG